MDATIPRVELEAFAGPLDLLLYLVKQEEVEITDIPIARICDRFLEELEHIRQLDLEVAGDFLVMASTLMLIKSRMLLPSEEPDEDEEWEDPRLELVEQLLEYRRVRETAGLLDEMRLRHARRHAREVPDPEELEVDAQDEELPLGEVSLGDLVAAFRKIVREVSFREPRTIVYDETPIHVHAADLLGRLEEGRPVGFLELLGGPGADRGILVGAFLALLELVRQGRIRAEQSEPFGEIRIILRSAEARPARSARAAPAAPPGDEEGARSPSLDEPKPAD